MTDLPTNEYMNLHIGANLGIYFDASTRLSGGLSYLSSKTIKDFYWNFAYKSSSEPWNSSDTENVRGLAEALEREPAIWLDHVDDVPEPWVIASRENWLGLNLGDWVPSPQPSGLAVVTAEKPTPAMVEVFRSAYSSGEPGGVGYFELPGEYAHAYAHGATQPPGRSICVALTEADRVVAIATLCLVAGHAGLYSVATHRDKQRQGFGRAVSNAALQIAVTQGASSAFLQTEQGGAAEFMYTSLGFTRRFTGVLCILPAEADA